MFKIRDLMHEKSLTQEVVAANTGISTGTVKNYLNHKTPMTVEFVEKFSKFTGIPVSIIFGEDRQNIVLNDNSSQNIPIELEIKIGIIQKELESMKELNAGMKRELELKDQIIELMKESKNLKLMKNGDKKKLD